MPTTMTAWWIVLGERLSMFEAQINGEKYHDLDYDDVDELRVRNSGAGVLVWPWQHFMTGMIHTLCSC